MRIAMRAVPGIARHFAGERGRAFGLRDRGDALLRASPRRAGLPAPGAVAGTARRARCSGRRRRERQRAPHAESAERAPAAHAGLTSYDSVTAPPNTVNGAQVSRSGRPRMPRWRVAQVIW